MHRCLDSAVSKSMIKEALTGWEKVYIAHHPSAKTILTRTAFHDYAEDSGTRVLAQVFPLTHSRKTKFVPRFPLSLSTTKTFSCELLLYT